MEGVFKALKSRVQAVEGLVLKTKMRLAGQGPAFIDPAFSGCIQIWAGWNFTQIRKHKNGDFSGFRKPSAAFINFIINGAFFAGIHGI